jgi:7-carboxy-7-deazaguanine synthase
MTTDEKDTTPSKPVHTMADRIQELRARKEAAQQGERPDSIDIAPVDRRATIILDVKCPGSGEVAKNRWENLEHLKPKDEIKFVIAGRADYDWAKSAIDTYKLDRWTILFSPVWGAMEMRPLAEWMLADRVPARLQTQLHKHIWGADVKGV